MSNENPRKRFLFEPTINLGHILSAATMLLAGAAVYSALSGRVSILEEKALSAQIQTTDKQLEQKESLREIKTDIKDLQRSVNEIGRAVASGKRP